MTAQSGWSLLDDGTLSLSLPLTRSCTWVSMHTCSLETIFTESKNKYSKNKYKYCEIVNIVKNIVL